MSEKPTIAVLLDAENINNLDALRDLIDQLNQDHRIVVRRAVGDWSRNIRSVKHGMQDLEFELVHQPNHVPHNNLADVRLVIEALELVHDPKTALDAFAIVSSDQDFLPLYDRLRELGKTVIVAGDKYSNSSRIEKHADIFIPIGNAQQPEIRHSFSSRNRRAPKRGGLKVAKTPMNKMQRDRTRNLIRRSLGKLRAARRRSTPLNMYRMMKRLDPKFSVRNLGFSRMTDLLNSFPEIITVVGVDSTNVWVRFGRGRPQTHR